MDDYIYVRIRIEKTLLCVDKDTADELDEVLGLSGPYEQSIITRKEIDDEEFWQTVLKDETISQETREALREIREKLRELFNNETDIKAVQLII